MAKLLTLIVALGISFAGVPAVSAEELNLDFTVHNETGVVIHKLFISPHSADDWEENILGKKTLADGDSLEIKFDPTEKSAKWDIRVEDADGNSIEWDDLKLTEITDIILHYKDGKATAELKNGDE